MNEDFYSTMFNWIFQHYDSDSELKSTLGPIVAIATDGEAARAAAISKGQMLSPTLHAAGSELLLLDSSLFMGKLAKDADFRHNFKRTRGMIIRPSGVTVRFFDCKLFFSFQHFYYYLCVFDSL